VTARQPRCLVCDRPTSPADQEAWTTFARSYVVHRGRCASAWREAMRGYALSGTRRRTSLEDAVARAREALRERP
jgi:hypothetical protein